MILILNPKLATSGGLLEVDDIYEDDDILRKGMLLDLLDLAIFFSEDKVVKLLLDLGANQDGNSPDGCCKLLFALKCRRYRACGSDNQTFNIIQHLLGAGADPNPRGVAITALQAAVICDCSSTVKLLLDAGAHVNAVGSDEAIVAGIERGSIPKDYPFSSEVAVDDIVEDGQLSQNRIQQLICARSILRNYETPLRIVEKRLHHADHPDDIELLAMINILEGKGGKSLNLYPGEKSWNSNLASNPSPPPVDLFPTQ